MDGEEKPSKGKGKGKGKAKAEENADAGSVALNTSIDVLAGLQLSVENSKAAEMSAELKKCMLGYGLFTLDEGWMGAKFQKINHREAVKTKYEEMGRSWTIEAPVIERESAVIYVTILDSTSR